jgi:diadenosine tetraphosphate (Ap4A) HIT family hydrolase
MQDKNAECLFCHIAPTRVIAQNELAYAIGDGFPVTPLHTLVIPKRHVADYFGLEAEELLAIDRLLHRLRAEIPGVFHALPTRLFAMYAPEIRANSEEAVIRIVDRAP